MDPPVSNGHVFAPKEVSIPLLVETTTKLFPGLTIQSRPCRPKAGFGLVSLNFCFLFYIFDVLFMYFATTFFVVFHHFFPLSPILYKFRKIF